LAHHNIKDMKYMKFEGPKGGPNNIV